MDNIEKIIKTHNKNILSKTTTNNHSCNCQRKDQCPLNGNCNVRNVIYAAHVTTLNTANNPRNPPPNHDPTSTRQTRTRRYSEHGPPTTNQNTNSNDVTANATLPAETTYIGAAEDFKARYRNHIKSFNNIRYEKDTELSKLIWNLKLNNQNYTIKWKILKYTSGYNKANKLCSLCTHEKLEIIKFKSKANLLNKRSELVSKCRHSNKFLLANQPDP